MLFNLSRPMASSPVQAYAGAQYVLPAFRAFSRGPYGQEYDPEDLSTARQWYAKLDGNTLPRSIAKTTFVTSSGPGGQKTNKTATKACTKWSVPLLAIHIPKILLPPLRTSRYYLSKRDEIGIDCDTLRKQSENRDLTHDRLLGEIRRIYQETVPGETSSEQAAKITMLQKSQNTARLKMKKQHSDKKKSRSGGCRSD